MTDNTRRAERAGFRFSAGNIEPPNENNIITAGINVTDSENNTWHSRVEVYGGGTFSSEQEALLSAIRLRDILLTALQESGQ